MNYDETIRSMPRHQYDALKTAIELGKWVNGEKLTIEQRENAMQAVIAYGIMHLSEEERVGYIFNPKHDPCGSAKDTSEAELKWVEPQQ